MEVGPDRRGYTRKSNIVRILAGNKWRIHAVLGAASAGLGERCGRARTRLLKANRGAKIFRKEIINAPDRPNLDIGIELHRLSSTALVVLPAGVMPRAAQEAREGASA